MMTLEIELRTSHLTAEKDAVIIKLARILARQLLTQASLLQDNLPPEIRVRCGDFDSATQDVKLFDDDGKEFDVEIIEAVERFDVFNGLNRIRVNAPKREVDPEWEASDEATDGA
jgi:hypothetical protein